MLLDINEDFRNELKSADFVIKFPEIIEKNRNNRVLVITMGEDWYKYGRLDKFSTQLRESSNKLALFPRPTSDSYGNNFPENFVELFLIKGTDCVLFNHVDKIPLSEEKDQWEYLIKLMARGEAYQVSSEVSGNLDLRFDFSRKKVVLLCSKVPNFIKSDPHLFPTIINFEDI